MAVIAQYDPKQEKLDNTIKLVDTGYYEADNGRVKSEFYETGNEVVFINKGRRISWKPENMKYLDEFGIEDVIYSVQDVPLEVKANYARYNRSMPDVDDWFIQENDRIKHQIIIQGFQRDPMPWLFGNIEFIIGGKLTFDADLKVVANGIEQTGDFETDGAIHLYDGDTLIFTLPKVVAFDSAYNRSMVFGKYRVTQNAPGEFLFDIVLSNEWVSSLDRVYPIVIDPTVVVASNYGITGASRKIIELSNGWRITAARQSNYLRIYVSKDSGTTWSELCYFLAPSTLSDHSLCSIGNVVHVLCSSNIQSRVFYFNFDATTVTPGSSLSATTLRSHFSADYAFSTNILADGNGVLYAIYQANASSSYTMPAALYRRSTDGGSTWSAESKVYSVPSLDRHIYAGMLSNNNPGVLIPYDNDLKFFRWNGSSFSYVSDIVTNASYQFNNSNFAVDSTGNIYVVWHKSTGQATNNIMFAKSTNNGATWSAVQYPVPSTGAPYYAINPHITIDPDDNIYIFMLGRVNNNTTDYYDVWYVKSEDLGATWSTPTKLTNQTTADAIAPNTLWSKYNMNATDTVQWIFGDGASIQYDYIALNKPPYAPTGLTRTNFDATDNAVFSWAYSDPDPSDNQSAYQLEIIDTGTGTSVYDSGKVASTTSSHTLPSGTLTNNKQYQWRVKTWDNSDTEGAWSDYATFYTSAKPSVTITNLTEGQTIITSSLTVQWTMSDPESEGQSAYQIKLTDMSDTVLYDTGKVIDSVSRSRTLGYELENHTDYKVKISVWDGRDVKSEEQVISIHVSFTPPAEPNVTTIRNNASITINIEHPNPVDPQPTVIYSDIFRRKQGESKWIRIATGVQNSFTDYTPASGVVYEYKVRAWGDNETYTDSVVVSESVEFTGVWLHDTTDPSTLHQFKYDGDGRSENWQPTAAMMQFAGRKLPIAEFDDFETRSITVNLKMRKYDTDKEMLEKLIRSKNTLCYRDGRGRKMFCHAFQLPIEDEFYGNTVSLTFEEVSYTEEV